MRRGRVETKQVIRAVSAIAAFAFLIVGGARAQDVSSVELAGLWEASRSFGPEVSGALSLRSVEGELWAEIAGYTAAVSTAGAEVRFELRGDRGYFRGHYSANEQEIRGHWVQPWTYSSFSRLASPVTLRRDAEGAWTGTVIPKPDRLRFYLMISEADDSRLTAFLRNPEANIGRFYPIDDITIDEGAVRLMDAEGRVRLEGRYDPDYDRLSIYFPHNGGTYDFARVDDGASTAFYPRPVGSGSYRYRRPPAAEGWETARPEDAGMAVEPLEEMVQMIIDTPIDAIDAPYIHGVLIARGGKLILEEYFHGYTRHDPHGTRSASKSMTTTLAGIAEHDGFLDLDTPVYATYYDGHVPEGLDPRALRMTLEHLLTMSPGLACNDSDQDSPGNEDVMQNQEDQPDWHRYALELPMIHEPGEEMAYCSAGHNLAGGVVAKKSGQWLPAFYQDRFARPVGAGISYMNLTPVGEGYGGGGLYIRPRDFLKLGQLYLDDGVWGDNRLLDAGWADVATTSTGTMRDQGYGYGWWIIPYEFEGRELKGFYAGGNGGQYVLVVPELDLNIVFFGGNYNQSVLHAPKHIHVPDYILRAIEVAELD